MDGAVLSDGYKKTHKNLENGSQNILMRLLKHLAARPCKVYLLETLRCGTDGNGPRMSDRKISVSS